VKRQRGSQRGLNKLVATNSNSHGCVTPGPMAMRSNTTDGYYKPRPHVSYCLPQLAIELIDTISYIHYIANLF
jgi:hypothetical protein